MQKLLSMLLVFTMLFSVVAVSATGVTAYDATDNVTTSETEVSIDTNDGLGSLISTTLEEQEESDEDVDIQNKILEVEIEGNNEGTTKVYFYDEKELGSSANVYAYTYRYLGAGGVNESLGSWPGISCNYEGENIWSVDMPNECTHIIFNYDGDTGYAGQTNDIPNPGKTMIAVRGSGDEINGQGCYHPIYVWEEYAGSESLNLLTEDVEYEVIESETETGEIIEENIIVDDLIPGEIYAFMMIKGSVENYSIDTKNLVYITDEVADETGSINYTYYYEDFDGEWICAIFGQCNHTEGDWGTIKEPTTDETGVEAQICTKCSEVLAIEEIPAEKTVYFENCNNWLEVYAYSWTESELPLGDWPGTLCTHIKDNIWCVKIPGDVENIIFNNNAGPQTEDLVVPGDNCIYRDMCVWEEYVAEEEEMVEKTVYFENCDNWSEVYAYSWTESEEPLGDWPGTLCTHIEDNIWCVKIPGDVENIIFSNGFSGTQTKDLVVPGDSCIYRDMCVWEEYVAEEEEIVNPTIYFAVPNTVETKKWHSWNGVDLAYGDRGSWKELTRINMIDTGSTYASEGVEGSAYLESGEWKIYSVTLTEEQMEALEESKYVVFINGSNYHRTALLQKYNVFNGISISGLDGAIYVIDSIDTTRSCELDSYIGCWEFNYFE